MIQVDGTWYCPAMPESLINATLDFRKGRSTRATYEARIEERRNYQMRPKAASPTPKATSGCAARPPNRPRWSAAS